ncbi:hypothetical protein NQ314_015486 [Rhamnusium bicolor]|uniref:Uncharacterized protein n=1 Tax=Rhamnusium bicolor TaxID=1586634 RepID=A0AAV8WYB5_9CUCU|nr:hypothetical protein NQ314_015486 [Rhamnusium bicolor]
MHRKRPSQTYNVGDKVWKRNFVLSNRAEHFAANLTHKFVLCTVTNVVSNLVYELTTEDDADAGKFHVKRLKTI